MLDRAARQRRINRQLEALENDNFQDDPHAGLPQLGKRLPQFDDDADTGKADEEEGRDRPRSGLWKDTGPRGPWPGRLLALVAVSHCVSVSLVHRVRTEWMS